MRLTEGARGFLLSNEIAKRFQEHVLLRSAEVDLELLKRHEDGIARVEISTHMQLCMAAGRARGLGDRSRPRLVPWFPFALLAPMKCAAHREPVRESNA